MSRNILEHGIIPEEIDAVTDENFSYSTSKITSCYSYKNYICVHVENMWTLAHLLLLFLIIYHFIIISYHLSI